MPKNQLAMYYKKENLCKRKPTGSPQLGYNIELYTTVADLGGGEGHPPLAASNVFLCI